jgi:epoxyqueuosine reductase
MNDLVKQQSELTELLKGNGASLVGFGDVSALDKSLTKGFPTAISIALHYDDVITNNLNTDEESFHNHLVALNDSVEKLTQITEYLLSGWGYSYKSIASAILIKSNEQLENFKDFPHKTAATRAGLGWIGKSALLVTPEYGPRVKLFTILTNADFIKAEPIDTNRCGNCRLCVNICPCKAIKNVGWYAGIERKELINVYECNTYRLNFIPVTGRKNSCGLCIKVCKFGQTKN